MKELKERILKDVKAKEFTYFECTNPVGLFKLVAETDNNISIYLYDHDIIEMLFGYKIENICRVAVKYESGFRLFSKNVESYIEIQFEKILKNE